MAVTCAPYDSFNKFLSGSHGILKLQPYLARMFRSLGLVIAAEFVVLGMLAMVATLVISLAR